jgi:hypothetical protein
MNTPLKYQWLGKWLLWLVIAPGVLAQVDPHIGYLYPAGGRQGTTFPATLGGRNLYATGVYVSGTGVSAKIIKEERQVTPAEQKNLREALSKIQEKRKQGQGVTPEEAKKAEEIRQKLNNFGRRLNNPSLGDFVTLEVSITPSATPGNREIRLLTPSGLSNPIRFKVGELPELSKKVWKDIPKEKGSMDPELDPKPPEQNITLPVTLNGQIPPGSVHRYRFPARAGQQLVVVVQARELIPYIPDAVPGWFKAKATLFDAKGQEAPCTADYQLHTDPVLFYKISANSDFVLEIGDALYRGREDFVYRITIGELPFVTGIFPLGGKTGAQATVTATGWNLSSNQISLNLKDQTPGIFSSSSPHPTGLAPFLFMTDILPESFENEPNNTAESAQFVILPIVINGRIDRPGDLDVFRFEGKAGEQIVAEVYARRLDSPLDSMLVITDAEGKRVAFNDDNEDKGSGLNTHHADSYVLMTLPATGSYYVRLSDTQRNGGGAYTYRLQFRTPRPDFELRVTPSSLNVHGGASVPLTVHALRKDGFTGPIALRLTGAPKGFTLTCAEVPNLQDQVRFTLNASPASMMEPFTLHLEGQATIQSQVVVHSAMPADDMMQAFAYRHLVPAQELKVAVFGRFRPGDATQILSATPVKIPVGGTAQIRLSLPIGPLVSKVEFELSEPPDGISIKEASPKEILFQTDAAKVKPGFKGNLIVKAFAEPPAAAGSAPPPTNRRRIPLGALPAIPYEIIAR